MKVTTTPKASRDLDEWIGRIAENNPLDFGIQLGIQDQFAIVSD